MKTSMIAAAAGAGFAAAQNGLPDIPECAMECLSTALPEIGCDDMFDLNCLCGSLEDIIQSQASCFTGACEASELMSIQEAALDMCNSLLTSTTLSISMPSTSMSGTETVAQTTVTSTIVTSSGMMMPSPTSGMTETVTSSETATETVSDGETGASGTESGAEATETGEGDGENAAGKPFAGLAVAALAIAAAL